MGKVAVTFCLPLFKCYEVKNNSCLFERLFKVKKNGVFLFGVSFLSSSVTKLVWFICLDIGLGFSFLYHYGSGPGISKSG